MLKRYFPNRKQGTKINDANSLVKFCLEYQKVYINIYICNMLFDINDCDFASYADGNSSYASRSNLGAVINNK